MMKQIQKGFTLIELMIVVAIIGILAAVAIPAYQDYIVKAKLSKVQTTLDPVKTALALYYQENGSFPTTGPNAPATAAQVTSTNQGDATTDPFWKSIGLDKFPVIPDEVKTMDVGPSIIADGSDAAITLELQNIKAATINGMKLQLVTTGGGTALVWTCGPGTDAGMDLVAKKYFKCD